MRATIDTLDSLKKFIDAGFTETEAEGLTEAIRAAGVAGLFPSVDVDHMALTASATLRDAGFCQTKADAVAVLLRKVISAKFV